MSIIHNIIAERNNNVNFQADEYWVFRNRKYGAVVFCFLVGRKWNWSEGRKGGAW